MPPKRRGGGGGGGGGAAGPRNDSDPLRSSIVFAVPPAFHRQSLATVDEPLRSALKALDEFFPQASTMELALSAELSGAQRLFIHQLLAPLKTAGSITAESENRAAGRQLVITKRSTEQASLAMPLGAMPASLGVTRGHLELEGLLCDAIGAAATAHALAAGVLLPDWAANRQARDGQSFHMTLVSKPHLPWAAELTPPPSPTPDGADTATPPSSPLKKSPPERLAKLLADFATALGELLTEQQSTATTSAAALHRLEPVCIGKASNGEAEAVFVVMRWPAGQAARAKINITERQHFHITLGFSNKTDVHGVCKDETSRVLALPAGLDFGAADSERNGAPQPGASSSSSSAAAAAAAVVDSASDG